MSVRIFLPAIFIFCGFKANAQYYYKDIILTRQNQDNWKSFREKKVREVNIQSIDANNEPTPGFVCAQTISGDYTAIATFTKSADIPPSTLTAYYDTRGQLIRTVDTSDTYRSTTEYTYNDKGQVTTMVNNSLQTDNQVGATEKHIWTYEGTVPAKMIKIKGKTDSTIVTLLTDSSGNVVEEKSARSGHSLPSVYYYYDSEKRLTDIVRYSQKAARLLPDYVFEYNTGHVVSMLFVPTGTTDYQRWIYNYNADGLKSMETCFDKTRKLVVKINYSYTVR